MLSDPGPSAVPSLSKYSGKKLLIINHASELGGAEFGLLDVARHYGRRSLTERLAGLGIGFTILSAGRAIADVRRDGGRLRALAAAPSVAALALRVARIARRYDVLYPACARLLCRRWAVGRLVWRARVWRHRGRAGVALDRKRIGK